MDFDGLKEVLHLLEGSRVAELEMEGPEGNSLRLRRVPQSRPSLLAPVAPTTPQRPSAQETADTSITYTPINALLVGRFHVPNTPMEPGQTVEEGQILGSIESMGLMNAVSTPVSGTLSALHVEDGQPVEYGQLLFEIE